MDTLRNSSYIKLNNINFFTKVPVGLLLIMWFKNIEEKISHAPLKLIDICEQ